MFSNSTRSNTGRVGPRITLRAWCPAVPLAGAEWDLAVLFVRLYRSLDSITAGKEQEAQAWLHSANRALNAKPVELMASVAGLVHVLDYLDAVRGRV